MPRKQLKHPDNYYKAFPSRLRLLMSGDAGKIKRTVSQQELADYLDLKARQSVSAYCDGSGQPSWENIVKIATYFGVSTDWLLGITDIETIKQDIRSAQKTLGLSDRAVENLAKVAKAKRYPAAKFDSHRFGAALNLLLSSSALESIAESLYHLWDASENMRALEQWSVEKLKKPEAYNADHDCDAAFDDYRLARLDITESIQALMDRDAAHFLSAQDAKALTDSFYARLEEAKRLRDLEDAAAAEKFDEEVREYQDYLEREGLDEGYGSDETEDN